MIARMRREVVVHPNKADTLRKAAHLATELLHSNNTAHHRSSNTALLLSSNTVLHHNSNMANVHPSKVGRKVGRKVGILLSRVGILLKVAQVAMVLQLLHGTSRVDSLKPFTLSPRHDYSL
jgi:hypothetical protein